MRRQVEVSKPKPKPFYERKTKTMKLEAVAAPPVGRHRRFANGSNSIGIAHVALIATHTKPGDTVLDVFAGSGTTGLATKLCDQPTEAMSELTRKLGIKPKWGPRHAVLYDIGVLGSFVSQVMCSPPDTARFEQAARQLVNAAEKSHGWLYETTGPDGEAATIRHTIWSDVLVCPRCDETTTYWDAAVRHNPLHLSDSFRCAHCKKTVVIDECERAVETVQDPVLKRSIERKRRVPVIVYGKTAKSNWRRSVSTEDQATIEQATAQRVPPVAPRTRIAWGDLYRSGYHTGITHLHHFYTSRNFLAVSVLWELVDTFDEDLKDALRLLILSFNASHSTLMTRVVVKQNQNDLVLTGAQSGVLYVSGLPVEKNVFEGVRRKTKTFVEAFRMVEGSRSTVSVVNGSSTDLDLPDGSVDYVFTDPPFGDYIPYAEINQLNEAWLGRTTDRGAEIVVSAAEGKDVDDYGKLMSEVFNEIARVLRKDAFATVVFHSAKASVWQALVNAYGDAGLAVETTSVLDKTQASFKQVVSTTMVKGDALILLARDSETKSAGHLKSIDEVLLAVLADGKASRKADERTKERLFSRFVTRCLVEGVPVSLGAAEFYDLADARARA